MRISSERLTPVVWWRISLAGLFLVGTVVAQNFGDWSAPVNLGLVNSPADER